ncbi:hypothetical protein [Tychonema sp. LEGE 06208]|nr:hypothetical protein [Tychonema sp. LEGE 06208]
MQRTIDITPRHINFNQNNATQRPKTSRLEFKQHPSRREDISLLV